MTHRCILRTSLIGCSAENTLHNKISLEGALQVFFGERGITAPRHTAVAMTTLATFAKKLRLLQPMQQQQQR